VSAAPVAPAAPALLAELLALGREARRLALNLAGRASDREEEVPHHEAEAEA